MRSARKLRKSQLLRHQDSPVSYGSPSYPLSLLHCTSQPTCPACFHHFANLSLCSGRPARCANTRDTLLVAISRFCSLPVLVCLLAIASMMVSPACRGVQSLADEALCAVASIPTSANIDRIKRITVYHGAWLDSIATTYVLTDGTEFTCTTGRKGGRASTYEFADNEVLLAMGGLLGFIKVCLGLIQHFRRLSGQAEYRNPGGRPYDRLSPVPHQEPGHRRSSGRTARSRDVRL